MPVITPRRLLSRLTLLLLLALTFVARTHNRENIFQNDGKIYFFEGDCYSRMTRAKLVDEGQWVIRHHAFENWPQGTNPHTTAPMDWLIVGLKTVIKPALGRLIPKSPLIGQELDLAGALISPILGVITAAWLWWWAGRLWLPCRAIMVLFFAISPVLKDGTILGRPDHQSLLILLIAVAVCAELALADFGLPGRLAKRWAIAAGVAWGLAMWVSFYEPLIFFAGAVGRHLLFHRGALVARAVRGRWIALGIVILLAIAIDGWRLTIPDAALREQFAAWSTTIAELRHLNLAKNTVWYWTGLFWVSACILLWFAARRDKRALSVLLLVAVMLGLTIWQLRWGYYLALAIAISIPWQLGAIGRAGWVAGLIGLIPMAFSWSRTLHPDPAAIDSRSRRMAAQVEWRRVAEFIKHDERRPFLAPWWVSPQVAYWSGQPGVTGTSHQSLAGIVDSARFYLSEKLEDAAAVLRARGVYYVIIDDSSVTATDEKELLIISNSQKLLGRDGQLAAKPLGDVLARTPRLAPQFLRFISPEQRGLVKSLGEVEEDGKTPAQAKLYLPQYHQLYEVIPDKL